MNDVLTIAQDVPNKKYADKIDSIKQDWDLEYITLPETSLVRKMDKLYNNKKDGWRQELQKLDQIVLLKTKLQELEEKLEVATNQGHKSSSHGYSNGTKNMYTIKSWRLEYKGESVKVNGKILAFLPKRSLEQWYKS